MPHNDTKFKLSNLEALPSELLDLIISEVSVDASPLHTSIASDAIERRSHNLPRTGHSLQLQRERRLSLYALCKTSRRTRKAAEPFLYEKFQSDTGRDDVRLFLRSLCERPSLAQHVRCVDVKLCGRSSGAASEEDMLLFEPVLRLLEDEAIYQDMVSAVRSGCNASHLILILAKIHRLHALRLDMDQVMHQGVDGEDDSETFELEDGPCEFCPNMEYCLQAIFSPRSTLPTPCRYSELESVWIQGRYYETWGLVPCARLPYSTSAAFLHLPALQYLAMSGLTASLGPWTCGERQSDVTSLILGSARLSSRTLNKLLRSCRRLKTIELFVNQDVYGHEDPFQYVQAAGITEALRSHRDHVENLIITNILNDNKAWEVQLGSLASIYFSDFTALRHLQTDEEFLFRLWPDSTRHIDVDHLLPPSLVSLSLFTTKKVALFFPIMKILSRFSGEDFSRLQIRFIKQNNDHIHKGMGAFVDLKDWSFHQVENRWGRALEFSYESSASGFCDQLRIIGEQMKMLGYLGAAED